MKASQTAILTAGKFDHNMLESLHSQRVRTIDWTYAMQLQGEVKRKTIPTQYFSAMMEVLRLASVLSGDVFADDVLMMMLCR